MRSLSGSRADFDEIYVYNSAEDGRDPEDNYGPCCAWLLLFRSASGALREASV